MKTPYAAHRAFVQPALGASFGAVLVIIVAMEASFFMSPWLMTSALPDDLATAFENGSTPLSALAQLFSFALVAASLCIMVCGIHGRGFWSMVGPARPTIQHMKIAGLAVFWVLLAREFLPPWIAFDELAFTRPLFGWAIWIIPTIGALIIQAGTEELYFRGYLQQQFAVMSDSKWVWMGLPSLLFGLGHYYNGFGPADSVLYVLWATLLGMACADLTARTGSIGAAVGLHVSNNLFAFMIVSEIDMPSNGLALFLYPARDYGAYDYGLHTLADPRVIPELLILALSVGVMWLAARIGLRA